MTPPDYLMGIDMLSYKLPECLRCVPAVSGKLTEGSEEYGGEATEGSGSSLPSERKSRHIVADLHGVHHRWILAP
jgi:hypothetical protein